MSEQPTPIQVPELTLVSVVKVLKQMKDAIEQLQRQIKELERRQDG